MSIVGYRTFLTQIVQALEKIGTLIHEDGCSASGPGDGTAGPRDEIMLLLSTIANDIDERMRWYDATKEKGCKRA